jgi:hypothetical protein
VAVKVAAVLPAATVTEAGTVSAAALLASATVAPAGGAGPLSEAVQLDDPNALRDAGAQLSALRVRAGGGGEAGVTIPPTPLMVSEFPPGSVPDGFVTLIAALATPTAIVTLTDATTPLCIPMAFTPDSRQV